MSVCVRDILKRPYFKQAKILAGHQGLNREVKWAHIVEIAKFGHLLNGNEVILTTGLGWADDEEKSISYLQQLLDYGAAALCVELVVHVKQLPQKMLDLAEKHDFPIISFTKEVRFIDITKDLHELLIGQHEKNWWRLENLYKEFHQSLISNGSAGDFLKILHKETNKQVALKYDKQYRFFPSPPKKKQYKWIKRLETDQKENYYAEPISLLGNTIAFLHYVEPKESISRFDQLALKRCSEIFSQFFWKHHQQKELQWMKKNEWLLDAISGSLSHAKIAKHIEEEMPDILLKEAVIAVAPFQRSLLRTDQDDISKTSLLMLLRPLFAEHGFQLFSIRDHARNIYVFLLINQQEGDFFNRLTNALKAIYNNNQDPLIQNDIQWMSFGKKITNYEDLATSYETALSTLYYQQHIERLEKPFYNNLAVYRLIDRIHNKNDIKEIITDYLQPLLQYDQENGTELVKTLQVFFKNLGARSETAEELNIVRQTLYHRLNRIQSLIGDDFMEPQKRLMLEFSMYALKYVNVQKEKYPTRNF